MPKEGNGFDREDQFLAAAFQWTWNTYPDFRRLFFHPVNEGNKDIVAAMQDRAKGLVAGVADLIFLYPQFFIELKQPGKKQNQAQKDFQTAVEARGLDYYIVEYMEDYKRIVTEKFALILGTWK